MRHVFCWWYRFENKFQNLSLYPKLILAGFLFVALCSADWLAEYGCTNLYVVRFLFISFCISDFPATIAFSNSSSPDFLYDSWDLKLFLGYPYGGRYQIYIPRKRLSCSFSTWKLSINILWNSRLVPLTSFLNPVLI